MQLTITNKKENKMLDRFEVKGKLVFNGPTPSKLVLTEALAKKMEVDMPLIVIKKLLTNFGIQEANFSAVAYYNPESLKNTEVITKHQKKKISEAKKKEAKTEEE